MYYVNNTAPNMFTLNMFWCWHACDIKNKQRTCWVSYGSALVKNAHGLVLFVAPENIHPPPLPLIGRASSLKALEILTVVFFRKSD